MREDSTVVCNICRTIWDLEFAQPDERDDELESLGWDIRGNRAVCSDCVEELVE